MKSAPGPRAPQQTRSRDTLEKLLNATVRILDQQGLEGAVIPRIAEAAGVAPASVYRRFADKDALLRAAFLHFLCRNRQNNRAHLRNVLLAPTLEETAQRTIRALFAQYRDHPHLTRALVRFLDTDTEPHFAGEARALLAANLEETVTVLMAHRASIAHRSPRRALRFAILHAVSSVELITLENSSLWHVVLPLADSAFIRDLTRSMVAYLQSGKPRSAARTDPVN